MKAVNHVCASTMQQLQFMPGCQQIGCACICLCWCRFDLPLCKFLRWQIALTKAPAVCPGCWQDHGDKKYDKYLMPSPSAFEREGVSHNANCQNARVLGHPSNHRGSSSACAASHSCCDEHLHQSCRQAKIKAAAHSVLPALICGC